MKTLNTLIDTVLKHYPEVQAIYLFGSYGAENEWPDSDVDIALLLPPVKAKAIGSVSYTHLTLPTSDLV